MNELTQKERYIQNAKDILKMLQDHPEFVPKMSRFCNMDFDEVHNTEHPCGTSYCLVGYQAHLDGYPEKYFDSDNWFDYHPYSEDKCGYLSFYVYKHWDFIYDGDWPDTRESAIARCQYIIDHDGDIPDVDDWEEMGWQG